MVLHRVLANQRLAVAYKANHVVVIAVALTSGQPRTEDPALEALLLLVSQAEIGSRTWRVYLLAGQLNGTDSRPTELIMAAALPRNSGFV
jgi:hypothetical protein